MSRDETRYDRLAILRANPAGDGVEVPVVLTYLRNAPVGVAPLSVDEALRLASDLIDSVRKLSVPSMNSGSRVVSSASPSTGGGPGE